ncbi:hypothetical protein LEP1GSC080_0056 [Leptospira interrogans str. FPW2026]|nr:hypothetical protein LEP1GSC080_0056 [Leptospira interrogans str. FPW2026]
MVLILLLPFTELVLNNTGKSPRDLKSYIQSNEGSSLTILKKPKIQSHS